MNKEFIVCQNKKAHHEYFIESIYQAGLVLTGTEIKSLRASKASIQDSYCHIKNNEIFIENMHIAKYDQGNLFNHDPYRVRKLLLHKKEIIKLAYLVQRDGYTLIPLRVYIQQGRCKMDLAVAKGKKLYDKREALKAKTIENEKQKGYD